MWLVKASWEKSQRERQLSRTPQSPILDLSHIHVQKQKVSVFIISLFNFLLQNTQCIITTKPSPVSFFSAGPVFVSTLKAIIFKLFLEINNKTLFFMVLDSNRLLIHQFCFALLDKRLINIWFLVINCVVSCLFLFLVRFRVLFEHVN